MEHIDQFTPQEELEPRLPKDNSKRARNLKVFFWVLVALDSLYIPTSIGYTEYLRSVRDGLTFSIDIPPIGWAFTILAMFMLVINLVVIVLFMVWFTRAYFNAYRIKASKLSHGKTMASWGFIIPIANYFIPYQVGRDIVLGIREKIAQLAPEQVIDKGIAFLGWWWFFHVLRALSSSFSWFMPNTTVDEIIRLQDVTIIFVFIEIVAALLAIQVVTKISREEILLEDFKIIKKKSALNWCAF